MDVATIGGIIIGFSLILMGILLGSGVGIFMSLPSAMIVVGGTAGATLVNFPLSRVVGVFRVVKHAFTGRLQPAHSMIPVFVEMAQKAKREGILSLESVAEESEDKFLSTGIQLAVDGYDLEAIEEILRTEIQLTHERHQEGADILGRMALFAPAFGMIGTLIGLVQMLQHLDEPEKIGPGMAVALITTFYGMILAYLIFHPLSGKLKTRSGEEILTKQLVLEGVLSISSGDNPRVVEQKLLAFLAPKERKSSFA